MGGGIPGGAGGLSIGTILILGLIGYATGIDPGMLIRGVETFQRQQPQVQQPQMQPKRTGPSASPKDETGKFVVRILGSNDVMWKEIFAKEGKNYRPAGPGAVQSGHAGELRWPRRRPHGTVLLPGRFPHLSRYVVLPADRAAVQGLRRRQPGLPLRTGLCDRARSRSSRAEPARHSATVAADAAQRPQQGGRQSHPGPGRTAGRLLRRHVGEALREPAGAGRHRGCAENRRRDRRRCAAAAGDRARGAGFVHPRLARRSASAGSTSASGRARSAPATRSRRRRNSERRCRGGGALRRAAIRFESIARAWRHKCPQTNPRHPTDVT